MFKPVHKYDEITFDELLEIKNSIKSDEIVIRCIHNSGIQIKIPSTSLDFFIEERNNNELFLKSKYLVPSLFLGKLKQEMEEEKKEDNYDLNEVEHFYHIYKNCIAHSEKLEKDNLTLLKQFIENSNKFNILKPYLSQIKLDYRAGKLTKEIVANIERLISGIGIASRIDFIEYIKYIKNLKLYNTDNVLDYDEKFIYNTMNTIVTILEKSSSFNEIFQNNDNLLDANILSHNNRVCIMMIYFLHYYNNLFIKGFSNKLRLDYRGEYLDTYKKIISNLRIRSYAEKLENIFKLGIRSFSSIEIANFAIGALYHDIALFDMIDFIPFDDVVQEGSRKGSHTTRAYYFTKYIFKQKYDIVITSALHHEYYGYGFTPAKKFIISEDIETYKQKIKYLLSFEYDDIINCEVYSYFPSKILEIIDIYDTLSYMNDEKLSPKDVVNYMKTELLEHQIKIDPIIFNLFVQFLAEVGDLDVLEYGFI